VRPFDKTINDLKNRLQLICEPSNWRRKGRKAAIEAAWAAE